MCEEGTSSSQHPELLAGDGGGLAVLGRNMGLGMGTTGG